MKFKNEVFIKGDEDARDSLSVDTIHEDGMSPQVGVQLYVMGLWGNTAVINLTPEEAERLIVEIRKILDNN